MRGMTSPFGTQPHVGPRHVETIVDTPRTVFNASNFWNVKLKDAAALDTTHQAAAVAEVVRQSKLNAVSVNTDKFTAKVVITPPDQPLVPVRLSDPSRAANSPALGKVFATGLPIPPDFKTTPDGDQHGVFWQPDYVSPQGRKGRYWEAWGLKQDADGSWSALWGGRINGTATSAGHFAWWTYDGYRASTPGDPDSTYVEGTWGATATSLPLAPSIITVEDLMWGKIEHAIGLIVYDAKAGSWVWPAQRSDGGASSGPAAAIQEGMRFRFPPGYVAPAGLHPVAQKIVDAVRDYGFVVNDRTLWCLAVRAEPDCEPFYNGTPYWALMDGFPWADLQLLAVGSDAAPNP